MFWKRKITNFNRIGPIFDQTLAKKEFDTMYELLKDAEKFDIGKDYDVSIMTLENLVKYISDYISASRNLQ
jgi:hypothetical protein